MELLSIWVRGICLMIVCVFSDLKWQPFLVEGKGNCLLYYDCLIINVKQLFESIQNANEKLLVNNIGSPPFILILTPSYLDYYIKLSNTLLPIHMYINCYEIIY